MGTFGVPILLPSELFEPVLQAILTLEMDMARLHLESLWVPHSKHRIWADLVQVPTKIDEVLTTNLHKGAQTISGLTHAVANRRSKPSGAQKKYVIHHLSHMSKFWNVDYLLSYNISFRRSKMG